MVDSSKAFVLDCEMVLFVAVVFFKVRDLVVVLEQLADKMLDSDVTGADYVKMAFVEDKLKHVVRTESYFERKQIRQHGVD